MAGLNVEDLMLSFETFKEEPDANNQQILKASAYLPAIQKHQPAGKWALVALRKVSFHDSLDEARAVLHELPVQGAIYPPPNMKVMGIPNIPGFKITELEYVKDPLNDPLGK